MGLPKSVAWLKDEDRSRGMGYSEKGLESGHFIFLEDTAIGQSKIYPRMALWQCLLPDLVIFLQMY